MKLYISGDMEGVAGVCAWEQVDARTPHPDFEIYRRYYTREVNSAIEGARAAGTTDVVVNDAHGPMRNILLEELPDDVRVIFGNRKPFSMVQDADGGFGGAFFLGYHGAAGDADAVLCHTYTPSVIYELHLNDIRCSEATLNAAHFRAVLGIEGAPQDMPSAILRHAGQVGFVDFQAQRAFRPLGQFLQDERGDLLRRELLAGHRHGFGVAHFALDAAHRAFGVDTLLVKGGLPHQQFSRGRDSHARR